MLLRIVATLALLAPLPSAAQQTCPRWQSLEGGATLVFQGDGWPAFTLAAEGWTAQCEAMRGGMSSSTRLATCDNAPDLESPLFFVPTDPTEPLGAAVLVFGTVPYYPTCD